MPSQANPKKKPQKDSHQLRYQLLFIGIIGLPSGIAGALIGPEIFQKSLGIDIVWWQGFLVGFLGGGMSAGITIARSNLSQRKHSTSTPGKTLPGIVDSASDEKSIQDQICILLRHVEPHFEITKKRATGTTTLALGELVLDVKTTAQSMQKRNLPTYVQTAIYLENRELNLPTFTLRPRRKGFQVFDKLITGGEVEFEDRPEFSKKYALVGLDARIQKLFSDEIKDFLLRQPVWEIHASEKRMILFVPKRECLGDDEKKFVQSATKLTRLFENRCGELQANGALSGPVRGDEMVAQVETLTGPLASLYQAKFRRLYITRDSVRGFVRQATPRTVPKPLLVQTRPDSLLLFAGVFLGVGSIIFATITRHEPDYFLPLVAISVGLILLSAAALFFALRTPLRKRWLLKNGTAVSGVITKVESTGFINANERMYRCYFNFQVAGKKVSSKCWLDGQAAQRAQSMIDNKESTATLVHPAHPQRCLLPELMAMA